MKSSAKNLEYTFERTLATTPETAFRAWLNPKVAGNPWNLADELLLNATVDGFFFWKIDEIAHYGRFLEVKQPGRLRHTWVSPNTGGQESTVTVTFRKKGTGTVMKLVHSGLPNTPEARSHEKGWNYFLDLFPAQFGA